MDILENIVFPQSPTNILLLKYLLFLTLLILLPYLSVILSTTLFSIMHFTKGKNSGNRNHLIFSNELIDLFTVNKGIAFTLGIIPMISLMFILSQLLLSSALNVNSHLLFTIVLFIAALVYIYTYKFSFRLKNIFNLVNLENSNDTKIVNEFEAFKKSNSKLLSKSGTIGFILLTIVAYILIGTLQIISDSSRWLVDTSFWDILFSTNTILYFLFYLSLSFSLTCAAIIFKYFKREAKVYDKSYLNYVKSFALKTGLIFTFIQPLLFVISILSTPVSSLSFSIFTAVLIGLCLMLAVSIMFYLMYKKDNINLSGSALLVFLILLSVVIYRDQLAFDTTSQTQMLNLNKEYKIYAAKVKEKAGIMEVIEISGEDIYNAKCIACHRFDTRLVGPPYNSVLPKYKGKMDELVDYILNPRKIDPEYTAMPNQGLRPKEAEAIAEYIVKIYQENEL
jgi:cytochrome c551/c552